MKVKELVVKLWGVVGYLIAVVGVIFSFVLAKGYRDFNFIVFVVGLVVTIVLTLIPFTVSVVLDRLDSIDSSLGEIRTKKSGTSEEMTSLEKMYRSRASESSFNSDNGSWTCPRCGKENHTGTCSCGMSRYSRKNLL